jgi:hypothetical protein
MKDFWKNKRFIWAVYSLAAVGVSAQRLWLGKDSDGYTFCENYVIFKNSFPHLVAGLNPYAAFPAEQWDLFKYSPAFALFMAPFAVVPDWFGLSIWNLLNALVLLAAILKLTVLTENQRVFMAWFVLIELVTSLQNSQSNGLTAGLMLWTFIAFERSKMWQAAGFIASSAFIKIFGIFGAALALLYPKKGRFSAALLAWTAFLTLAPLLVVSPKHLWQIYGWWWELLLADHAASVGLSVQGWLQTWFGWMPSKLGVTLAGTLMLLASVAAVSRQSSVANRTLACASLLIWVVIFNHKAESPTFIIALCGVALWWFVSEKKIWEKFLFWATFALVSLSPTDIFPKEIRSQIVQPYVLKAVPCIVIWVIISWRMLSQAFENKQIAEVGEHHFEG